MSQGYSNKPSTIFLHYVFLFMLVFASHSTRLLSQAASDTFDLAEIPTSLGNFDPSCNGPLTKISITLPSGGPWNVSGIDISYNMTAQSGGFKSHQRSYIRCQTTATSEDTVYSGSGNTGGIQTYNRPNVDIANGYYPGGTTLHFEMRAWRTNIGSGCNPTYNKVDNFTWIITVHYAQIPDEGSVGIGTTTPAASAILDLSSTTQAFLPPRMTTAQRDAIASPVDGMMIFNTSTKKIEVYISGWSSFSSSSTSIKKLFGGTADDISFDVLQTNDGGFIITGYSFSSNTGTLAGHTNNGEADSWSIKLDNAGEIDWQKLMGGTDFDFTLSVDQTSDGGFILAGVSVSSNSGTMTGLTNNGYIDMWIVRLNNSGNITWQKLYGGTDEDRAECIRQTEDGGFIVCGYTLSSNSGTLTGLINNGSMDSWILKLDSNGNIIWQKLMGGINEDYSYDIRQTTDGGFIVSGSSFSSNTGTMAGLTNNGQSDLWTMKLDNVGNIQWQKLYGGSAPEIGTNIEMTSDGGYIISCDSQSSNSGTMTGLMNNGNWDYLIMKISDSGIIEWQKLYGGSNSDQVHKISPTPDGGYIATGYSLSSNTGTLLGMTSNGSYDFWTMKLNSVGVINWQKLYGGSGGEIAYGMDLTNDGGYILVGDSDSNNSGTLVGLFSNGEQDSWILKLDSSGNPY